MEMMMMRLQWGGRSVLLTRMYLRTLSTTLALLAVVPAVAQVIDPEKHIQKYGYHETETGRTGVRTFKHNGQASPATMAALKKAIAELPKEASVRSTCNSIISNDKERLAEEQRLAKQPITINVSLADFGSTDATIACALKVKRNKKVSTELLYIKLGGEGVYYVTVEPD
ncbi:hypothetical protein [Noviherbaspirillum sp. UKPF54]|uniref:hypothetical protein n=1 Tax=Noviherbaspirillum sp. UKPF54 TaxID=2601898 RepID=UPI0011B14BC9|nr:hypothetical protein [Noviherbaspirillum sp. UKPF54]QDZ26571.1 hypothetical protein FAY22_00465 [Noviherbaspirillum sp. UKPF54]